MLTYFYESPPMKFGFPDTSNLKFAAVHTFKLATTFVTFNVGS